MSGRQPSLKGMTDVMVSARQDLEVLYREHGKRLWWALVAFSGDRDDRERRGIRGVRAGAEERGDIKDPLAWIWKAAFRIAAGELKERGRQTPRLSEPMYELPEPAAEVTAALRQLPPQQRAAVVLHYYADRPIREIAELMGTSSSTVAVHLHRGRNRLRGLLGDDDG